MTFEQLKDILNNADEELLKAEVSVQIAEERFDVDLVQSGTTSEFLLIPVFNAP